MFTLTNTNRPIFSLFSCLIVVVFLSAACGGQKSGTSPIGNSGITASEWQPGMPPPVGDDCFAGDADFDGFCDDTDPDPNNPDVDGDGAVDGMDQTPTGGGDGGGGHTWWTELSPLI